MRLGDDLCQIDYSNKQVLKKEAFGFRLDSNFISKRIDQISEVQKKMDDILPKALLTESKIQIIKDHGCKSWLMVVGEHDHARDGAIVLGKRLEKVGLICDTVIVRKAFHGFFINSKLLGGFEEKDDKDVSNILFKISEALNTGLNE